MVIISCSPNSYEQYDQVKIEIDVTKELDLTHTDFFENVFIIPLETADEILIGNIDDVIFTEDRIYILDKGLASAVFIFENSGRFSYKIESTGMGPGELYAPVEIEFNQYREEIVVLDGRQGKFLYYDKNGRFLRETKRPGNLSALDMFVQHNKFYFVNDEDSDWSQRLVVQDENLNDVKTIKVHFGEELRLINGKKSRYFYEKYDKEGFYYKESGQNIIYEIVADSVERNFLFSFSQDEFKARKENIYQMRDYFNEFWKSEKFAVGDDMIDSKDFALLGISKGEYSKLALWDKTNHHVQLVRKIVNNMDGITPDINGIPPLNSNANQLTWAFHSKELEYINKNSEHFKRFKEEYKLGEDDNPVFFIYKMKPSIEILDK